MKTLKLFFIILTALMTQSAAAEVFQIVNELAYPVKCVVYTKIFNRVFDEIIPAYGTTKSIDIENKELQLMKWNDNGMQYNADFSNYALQHQLKIPLQKNKKNFLNICANGVYMHNFGGYILYESATTPN